LSHTLAEILVSFTDFTPVASQSWQVAAVPLHASRLRWRGFNQSELLASHLADYFHAPLVKPLKRVRSTLPQSLLTGHHRFTNVKNAFSAVSPTVSPANLILVDDVVTTGTTLLECAKSAKRAGWKKVWAVVLAQSPNSPDV